MSTRPVFDERPVDRGGTRQVAWRRRPAGSAGHAHPDPIGYPWQPVRAAVIVARTQTIALPDGPLTALAVDEVLASIPGAAPVRARRPLICVGGDRAPEIMRAALANGPDDATVPMIPATVAGIGVGHAAAAGAAGYLATTPFANPIGRADAVVAWVTPGQLRTLDGLRPDDRRVMLDPVCHPVTSCLPVRPGSCTAYVSRHGVLAIDGRPVHALPQPQLLHRLAQLPAFGALLAAGPRETLRRFASDETLRERMRGLIRRSGLVADSGLAEPAR